MKTIGKKRKNNSVKRANGYFWLGASIVFIVFVAVILICVPEYKKDSKDKTTETEMTISEIELSVETESVDFCPTDIWGQPIGTDYHTTLYSDFGIPQVVYDELVYQLKLNDIEGYMPYAIAQLYQEIYDTPDMSWNDYLGQLGEYVSDIASLLKECDNMDSVLSRYRTDRTGTLDTEYVRQVMRWVRIPNSNDGADEPYIIPDEISTAFETTGVVEYEQETSEKEIQADIQDESRRNGDGNDEIVKTADNGSGCRCNGESNQISDGCNSDSCESGIGNDAGIFVAYGIWSGAYWHFTPEQIDAQWAGYKTGKPVLQIGTTRAWQRYLYDKLTSIGAGWFYKYAVAQAMQESGFNPLNNVGRTQISWLNGMATYDCGLYSFKDIYWNPAYGDVCDYHANINAYITRVSPYLAEGEANVKLAIAQHYDAYHYHEEYVQYVLGRLNELWEVE